MVAAAVEREVRAVAADRVVREVRAVAADRVVREAGSPQAHRPLREVSRVPAASPQQRNLWRHEQLRLDNKCGRLSRRRSIKWRASAATFSKPHSSESNSERSPCKHGSPAKK